MQFDKTIDVYLPASDIAASPDGTALVVGDEHGELCVMDVVNGGDIWTTKEEGMPCHQGPVNAVAWSPDGRSIASGGCDGSIKVWEAQTGCCIMMYSSHDGPITDLSWSPTSKWVSSASEDETVQIWCAGTGEQHLCFKRHSSPVQCVAWSHGWLHEREAVASGDREGRALVWCPDSGIVVVEFTAYLQMSEREDEQGQPGVSAIAFSPDDVLVASTSSARRVDSLQIWSAETGAVHRTYPEAGQGLQWRRHVLGWKSEREAIAAATDGSLHVVDKDSTSDEVFRGVTVGRVGRVLNSTSFISSSYLDWYIRQWSL